MMKNDRQHVVIAAQTCGSLIIAAAFTVVSVPAFGQSTPDTVTSSNVVIRNGGNSTYPAQVDAANKLDVGPSPPNLFFHSGLFGIDSLDGCQTLVTAPTGKKLDVQQIRFDVVSVGNTGLGYSIAVYTDAACGNILDAVHPTAVGPLQIAYPPGLATTAISAKVDDPDHALAFDVGVDGFYIPASAAPSPNVTIRRVGKAKLHGQ